MNNYFQTTNLSLAAALLASGKVKFIKIIQSTPYTQAYIFVPNDLCEEIQAKYVNNELLLPVRIVEQNIKVLKSLSKKGENYA